MYLNIKLLCIKKMYTIYKYISVYVFMEGINLFYKLVKFTKLVANRNLKEIIKN